MQKRIIFIVGPTAVGKTRVASHVAKKINGRIISCDSMQLYKGMDVIVSTPDAKTRKAVPHDLVSCISPAREYNVAAYRRAALSKVREAVKKKKVPLFVGGTGHYMTILLDGLFKAGKEDKSLRKKLFRQAIRQGSDYLHRRLKRVDPQAAEKIHPHDTKRIVRALEVYKVTGKPISQLQKKRSGLWDKYDIRIFCLNTERNRLYRMIDARVESMFERGVVKEVKRLLDLKLSRTASCAIGIREIKGYLQGLYGLEESIKLMQKNTRHYAKRQLTWFRKDKRIEWVELGPGDRPGLVADKIIQRIKTWR